MRELGGEAASRHKELGQLIREVTPAAVFFRGDHYDDVVKGFGGIIEKVTTAEDFIATWNAMKIEHGVVLVKGSRSLKMEELSGALCKALGDSTSAQGGKK